MPLFVRVTVERTKCEWLRCSLIWKCHGLLAKTEVLIFVHLFDFIIILTLIYPLVENALFYSFLNLMFVCNQYSNKCGYLCNYFLFFFLCMLPRELNTFLTCVRHVLYHCIQYSVLSCCFLNYLISSIK